MWARSLLAAARMKTAPIALVFAACALAACGGSSTDSQEGNATAKKLPAGDVRFECKTSGKFYGAKTHTVSFTVLNAQKALSKSKGDVYSAFVQDEDDYSVVSVSPSNSKLAALDENGGARISNGKLIMEGDSDGFFLVELVLYRNSGFSKGYVSLTDTGEGIGDQYSKISCTHTKVAPQPSAEAGELVGSLMEVWDTPDYDAPRRVDPGPYSTGSDDPMEMLKDYVAEAHSDDDPDDFKYLEEGGGFTSDEMTLGLVSYDVALAQVQGSIEFYFDNWEDVDAEQREKDATELMEKLRDEDVVFGFDGWEQSGCAAPVNVMLVLSPSEKKVWAVELEPCSES